MTSKDKKHLDNILNCFSGADGGVSFTYLKTYLEVLSEISPEDNRYDATQKVLNIVRDFSRLITIIERHYK